jgi:hypothetical protein
MQQVGHDALQRECQRLADIRAESSDIVSGVASIASNGYSNLESWLNSMDQSMEGVAQASSPASPPVLSVQ